MLNFFAPINQLGYGTFSYELIKAYDGCVSSEVALFPIPWTEITNDRIQRWMFNCGRFSRKEPSIMICQAGWLNRFCGQPMIGFPIFETEVLPENDLQIVRQLDVVLQASQWGKTCLEKQGVRKVHLVPGGYDPEKFHPDLSWEARLQRIDQRGISFVHVGKFEERKSSEEILRCFSRACEGVARQVNLMFHVNNPFDDQWREKVDRVLTGQGFQASGAYYFRDHAQVIVPEKRSEQDLRKVYQMAEFGIWASKGEGWNLPLIECLACGLPCITTDNTAQGEFIRRGIYPGELILKNQSKEPTGEGKPWRRIDEEELTTKIRMVIDGPERFLKLSDRCLDSIRDYTWENGARSLGKVLKGLGL